MKRIKRENIESINLAGEGFSYIWIQEYGKVVLAPIGEVSVNYDRVIEARAFSDTKELHIYDDDGLRAVETVYEDGDDCFEEKQLLRGRFGNRLVLRNFVEYDEDGQAFIAQTVVCGYECDRRTE